MSTGSGVLVNNASSPGAAVAAGTDYGCGRSYGQGNCSRGDINSSINRPAGYDGHNLMGVAVAGADTMDLACKMGCDINRGSNGIALPSYANDTFQSSKTAKPIQLVQGCPCTKVAIGRQTTMTALERTSQSLKPTI